MPTRRPSLRSVEERNALVEANTRLVPWVVRRFADTSDEEAFQQRVSAGYLGLIRAAELFDESLGFKFSTYALNWIRQAIQRDRSEALIHVPVNAKLRGVQAPRLVSLNAPLGDDGGRTLGDLVAAPEDDREEELTHLRELLDRLPDMERRAVLARHRGQTRLGERVVRSTPWRDVQQELGVANERLARELYAEAIARLRELAAEAA